MNTNIKTNRHSIPRWLAVQTVGQTMRITRIPYRFTSDWRHGVKWYHRAVYSVLCTFACNIIADGGKWPLYL